MQIKWPNYDFFLVEKFPDISHQHLQETEKISAFFLLRDLIQRGTYLVQDRSLQQESITGASKRNIFAQQEPIRFGRIPRRTWLQCLLLLSTRLAAL